MNALNIALENLKSKHRGFIGNRKDEVASANADGFKQGLAWAIKTIETAIELVEFTEKYDKEMSDLYSRLDKES